MRMMRDCEKGKIDLIITKSVARFARNVVDSLNYVRRLKAKGIGVYFEEQALDSLKTENEMALGIYSVLAQAESEILNWNWYTTLYTRQNMHMQVCVLQMLLLKSLQKISTEK